MDEETGPPLTTLQAARLTGLHPTTLQKAAAAGRVPAYRLLGVWRFPRELLQAWMQARFNQQTEKPGRVQAEPSRAPASTADAHHPRRRRGTPAPSPESHPPLVVLFPHAAHRGVNDLPAEPPATRSGPPR